MNHFIITIISVSFLAFPMVVQAGSNLLLTVPPVIAASNHQPFINPDVAYPDDEVSILPNYNAMRTLNNEILVLGEVYNNTSAIIRFIKVSVSVFDGEGRFITSYSTFTYRENLPPAERACFQLTFPATENVKSLEFTELFYLTDGIETPKLTVMGSAPDFDSSIGKYKLVGLVGNENEFTVTNVKAIGTIYTSFSSGNSVVAGCDFNYVKSRDLSSGQSSEFEIIFDDYFISNNISEYSLALEGN